MTKYHITDNGPKPCKAVKRPCPVGGEHFESKAQAQNSYENAQEDSLKPLKKRKSSAISKEELKSINDFKADQTNFNKLYIRLGDDSDVLDSDLSELEARYPSAFAQTNEEFGAFNSLKGNQQIKYFEILDSNLVNEHFEEGSDFDKTDPTPEENEEYYSNLITKKKNPLQNKTEINSQKLSKKVEELLASDNSYHDRLNGTIQEFAKDHPEAFNTFNKRYFTYSDETKPIDKESYTIGLANERTAYDVNEAFKDL